MRVQRRVGSKWPPYKYFTSLYHRVFTVFLMKLKMFSTKISNFTQRNCSYINEWFLRESHLGSRGCGSKSQGVAQIKLSNLAVPVFFTDWQICKGNGMWVKWRFYDSLLLSNCENTTYPDFKNWLWLCCSKLRNKYRRFWQST